MSFSLKAKIVAPRGNNAFKLSYLEEEADGSVAICGPSVNVVDASLVPPELRKLNSIVEVYFEDRWTIIGVRSIDG